MVNQATENFKTIKKNLETPVNFKKNTREGKACFSYNYKMYGSLETWDLAWERLKELPHNENIFHELIMENSKVKPYLDIEWYQEKYPTLTPERVLLNLKENIISIFKKEWDFDLQNSDIYTASCHRGKTEGYKYSFRIIISTHSPQLVFENTNCASYLGKRLRVLCKDQQPEDIIDMGVYKKTQNIRFIGHSKAGEYIPMQKMNISDEDTEYIITNIDPQYTIIEVPEQKDFLYKTIKGIKGIDFDDPELLKYVIDKIKTVHPSCEIERIDANKFIQLNYDDRTESCFCGENIIHDKIGFFCYIQGDLICLGCHSGNCVDHNNKKIIKILGSISSIKQIPYEKVDYKNVFNLDHLFIKKCIFDGSYGVSNMFERMYLEPKRIKWINDSNIGSTFYWDGKLWKQDEYSFIERLITSNVTKIIRDFTNIYTANDDENITLDVDETVIKEAKGLVKKLNEGSNLNNILRFLKPLINDFEFLKVKDIHPYFLSCNNGVVDLKTGEIRPCVPGDNITKSIETSYDKHSRVEEFDNFVRQITSSEEGEDVELYNYFRWFIGYCMQGNPIKKMFFILYGEKGYNGKSLVLNIIKDVLSFYAVTMDKSVIVDTPTKTGGSHSTEICQLENSRMGILSETKEDEVINDGQIKILTGITDKMSVREIYGKQKEFTPTFVPIVSSNFKLKINLKDKAMYERLILIPFRLSFMEHPNPKNSWEKKGDPLLAEKFTKNKEGILKWLIESSIYYNQNMDMIPPETVNKAKQEYKRDMDDYADFIERQLVFTGNKKDFIIMNDISRSYKQFCMDNRIVFDKRKAEKMLDDSLRDFYLSGRYHSYKFKEDEIDVEHF